MKKPNEIIIFLSVGGIEKIDIDFVNLSAECSRPGNHFISPSLLWRKLGRPIDQEIHYISNDNTRTWLKYGPNDETT